MIFHDSTKKLFFPKHQNNAKFNTLDDSEVLSSDFSGLKTSTASMTSVASMASMTSTASESFSSLCFKIITRSGALVFGLSLDLKALT